MRLEISYAQFFIYDAAVVNPFAEWRNEYTDQGFARMESAVTFTTLIEEGLAIVRAHLEPFGSADGYDRVIRVPFRAISGAIKVEAVGDQIYDDVDLRICPGHYTLVAAQSWCGEDFDWTTVDALDEDEVQLVDLFF